LDSTITQKIFFEIDQIDDHINASSSLFNLYKIREPDYVEKCGISMILHSFYNGIENILLLIIKNKDSNLPNGTRWHKELLDTAFEKTKNRTEIFREEIKIPLSEYLKFRHFVRNTYGFQLKWEDMKTMLFNIPIIWNIVKEDLKIFIENN
jgi:hypothetical protein